MTRQTSSKAESFNFRVNSSLKAAFSAAAAADERSAAQLLRNFMRLYVEHRDRRKYSAEARRQSLAVAEAAADPATDEAAVMREIEAELTGVGSGDEWR